MTNAAADGPESKSQTFLGADGVGGFLQRAFTKRLGYTDADLRKPVIGICNTWSELNPCHGHFKTLANAVREGIIEAGGLPVEFPTVSLGEIHTSPTAMLYRNMMAIDTEEMLRSQPLDACVLLGGCDKTIPAQLMAVASADLPSVILPGGAMAAGRHGDQRLGACTDCRRLWQEVVAGELPAQTYRSMEESVCRTAGHCMVMGTASTMSCLAEALGMALPGSGTVLAADPERVRIARATGRRAVELAREGLTPSQVLTPAAFRNATIALMALAGSTNAVIHLTAIARRAGVDLKLEDFEAASALVPVLANVRPSGAHYMEDFHFAGGMPALLSRVSAELELEALTVTGLSIGETIEAALVGNEDVIRPLDRPLFESGGLKVIRGNLAPDGAIIKVSAATPELLCHEGPALVIDGVADVAAAFERHRGKMTADMVLVVRNVGPLGGPGMPETANVSVPEELASQGIRDMVRISDGRMSGTSYGTVVLHVAPEAAAGGPLALVEDGDLVRLDVSAGTLDLLISEEERAGRAARWQPPAPAFTSGYGALYLAHVNQADAGCDFDFLLGNRPVSKDIVAGRQPRT